VERIRLDLLARALDQRSNNPASHRGDPAKPARPGTAEQIHQHGLGLIILVMAHGDLGRPLLVRHPLDEPVTEISGGVL
jgi:hypothetical protein